MYANLHCLALPLWTHYPKATPRLIPSSQRCFPFSGLCKSIIANKIFSLIEGAVRGMVRRMGQIITVCDEYAASLWGDFRY